MNKINLRDIPEQEQRSPSGKFHSFAKNISLALGGERNVGTWGGAHPFDLQLRRVPPGAAVCPYHLHLAQWELFVIRRGEATLRVDGVTHPVRTGDAFIHPPGEAHQLTNTGSGDLEVFIIADNPPLDAFFYPDSNKWGLRPPGRFFRLKECDYFDGEDDEAPEPRLRRTESSSATHASAQPTSPWPQHALAQGELAPFVRRKVSLDALPWEPWQSPKGKFRAAGKSISVALGAKGRTPLTQGGHPFDLELGRVPPGATICPFHSHSAQWEFYVFLAGTGEFRLGADRFAIEPGDCVLAKPGVPHNFRNTGDADLDYYLVADDPLTEFWHYPDSGKYGFSNPRRIFRLTEADYEDGE